MGEQAGEGAGSGPALHRERVFVDLAMFVDSVRWRSLCGLFAMAHEHDDFRGLASLHHMDTFFFASPVAGWLTGRNYLDASRRILALLAIGAKAPP
jgi:hypothetical protein